MRYYTLALLAVVLLVLVGCESIEAPGKPSVTYEPIEDGAKLRLTWTAVTDADGYYIYVDGTKDTSITGTSFDVTGPAKEIEVSAYNNSEESEKWSLDLTPKMTSSIVVYGISDPDPTHSSGIKFANDGSAVPISVAQSPSEVDFYLDDVNFGVGMWFASPKDPPTPINDRGNVVEENASADFDAVDIAAAPGNYISRVSLAINDVRSIWLDRNDNGYDDVDYFGKIKIENIEIATKKVTITTALQTIRGLRWVVTP